MKGSERLHRRGWQCSRHRPRHIIAPCYAFLFARFGIFYIFLHTFVSNLFLYY